MEGKHFDLIPLDADAYHSLIRQVRLRKNLKQQELAQRAGISQQTVSAIETGNLDPSLKVLLRLASALDVVFLVGPTKNLKEEVLVMNLQLVKELEDLKSELSSVLSKLAELNQARKVKCLTDAAAQFTSFFTAKGFNVTSSDNPLRYRATYGSYFVEITLAKPEDTFIGIHSRIDMVSSTGQKHIIPIGPIGAYPTITTKVRPAPKTEEDKLRMEIEDTREHLENSIKQLEAHDKIEWGYGLVTEENKTRRDYPQFKTFTELLQYAFPE